MKKIIVLGSTGSIGRQTLDIIKKDKKNFKVLLLSTDKNLDLISKQIKTFNVKNIIVTNYEKFILLKKKFKNISVFNDFKCINKIIKKKVDYTMCAISGINGLKPTLNIINKTKRIAIANKESIICGWSLIKKELKKNHTEFVPVDSEHFSIWSVIKDLDKNDIDKIFITASGGPFLKKKIHKNIKPIDAIKHPNWKMGKKISVDSATLMNKVFEVIEAKKIFDLNYNNFEVLIHPKSYVHAIIKLKNGLIKIVAHETNMKIPIFNSIYSHTKNKKILKTKKIDFNILNSLNFQKVNIKKFPLIKILKIIPSNESLFESILVSINDQLVELFLDKKINFSDLMTNLTRYINLNDFTKFKRQKPKNLAQIERLNQFVRLKTSSLSVISNKK